MLELGQLEKSHEEFSRRGVKVYVISNDDLPTAKETQNLFPHLVVVADPDQTVANAVQVVHQGAGPKGGDTNAPTTFVVDGAGNVRWLFRPGTYFERLPAAELITATDQNLPK